MLHEAFVGLGAFFGYYAALVAVLPIFRVLLGIRGEWFRKLLHIGCVMSVFVLLHAFDTWYLAVFTALAFAFILYPVITFVEKYPRLMQFLHERRSGEIRSSLVTVFIMMATLITVFWGLMGPDWKYLVAVSVLTWGIGDAAAALIGKNWGRRRIEWRWADGNKTIEGTSGMYVFSVGAIVVTLLAYASFPWYICFSIALLAAPVSAIVELVSHRGLDTITVPFATAATVFILIQLFHVTGVIG